MKKMIIFLFMCTFALVKMNVSSIETNIAKENLQSEDLTGNVRGNGIEFGSQVLFRENQTYNLATARLDSTHFVVVYGDNYSFGACKIGTAVGEDSISFGAETVFWERHVISCSVTALTSSSFVIAFVDCGSNNAGTAIAGQISGNSVSFGSEEVFNENQTDFCSVDKLSSNSFAIAFKDIGNANFGTTVVGSISGTTLSFGTKYVFNDGKTDYCSLTALSGSEIVVAYEDCGNDNYGTAIKGVVSGSSVSFGSEAVFCARETKYCSAVTLANDYFAVAYVDVENNSCGSAVVGELESSQIHFGSSYVYNDGATQDVAATALDSRYFSVSYNDFGYAQKGVSCVGKVSGKTINFGSEYVFCEGNTHYCAATNLRTDSFVTIFSNLDNGRKGTAIIGVLTSDNPTPIILGSFTVSYNAEELLIVWTTLSETNNLGWNIYRSESKDFDYFLQVNSGFIPAAGTSSETCEYSYSDEIPIEPGKTYYYRLESVCIDGTTEFYGPVSFTAPPEEEENPESPVNAKLGFDIYPNPFDSSVNIAFSPEENETPEKLEIYNQRGQKIKTLFADAISSNSYSCVWNGKDDKAKPVADGIYFIKIKFTKSSRNTVVKTIKLK